MAKEDVASDFISLSVSEQAWVAREIGEHYIANESVAIQDEFSGLLEIEGFSTAPFCRKKKSPPSH